jgi:signal transduction histidine kinase
MLRDYSFRIKKNIGVLLHVIFLTLIVAGISIIYTNSRIGNGVGAILRQDYDDSEQFRQQFQADLDHVFKYISYRDVFETDGALDLSKEMFSITRGDGPEIIYTLEEVLRYAKSQGFYLNDRFEVVNDLFLYDNASMTKDQLVNWRAYPTEHQITEPGDAYTSLLDLSKEVLSCLSEYYTVYYRMMENPSNFHFKVVYDDDFDDPVDEDTMIYTNCPDAEPEELMQEGRYCYMDSSSIVEMTNLPDPLRNITVSLENNNFYDMAAYYVVASVDTDFPADDIYREQYEAHYRLQEVCREGLTALGVGLVGAFLTLIYLISVAGYRYDKKEKPFLQYIDTISVESCLLLTVILALFLLFLAEKVGYKLVHLLVAEDTWNIAERLMDAVIIYTCTVVCGFSILRRYKAKMLWKSSILHRLKEDMNEYFAKRTFSYRLFCVYGGFLILQIIGISIIGTAILFRRYPAAKLTLVVAAVILVMADYRIYRKLFHTSEQEDRIADAIEKIAGGDTSYQMPLDGLDGKELSIAQNINLIGTGLERAIQEQFKSERLKADLITNVSHDIKTPLTSIINYVDLIRREHIENEHLKEYLAILEQKSQRLKTLTEDLVEASKASSGNLKLDMMKLDLVEMIWQTNGEFEEKYQERHLELVSTLPSTGLMIEADGRHLWRVLENLYNNAYKYAMENSRIYTDVTSENGMAWFTIKNVSEHPLNVNPDELTERFVRGDVSRSTEGSGLGLSIAQSLTKLQGGTFELFIDGDLFKARVGFPLVES